MYKFLFVYLLVLPGICMAQSRQKANQVVKLNLTTPLDIFTFPTLQIALEQKITRKISIEGEFGYQVYDLTPKDTSFVHPAGYKAGFTVRYYMRFREKNDLTGFYFGLNPFYRQNKYNRELFYNPDSTSAITLSDSYYVDKKCWGINMLAGVQKNLGKRFFIDGYIGIGPMIRDMKNFNREYDPKKGQELNGNRHRGSIGENYGLSENEGWTVNFTMRWSLGIRLF